MSRNKDERNAAATAAERGGAALVVEQALEALAPIVAKAALQATVAKKAAAPLADAAKDRLAPVTDQAKDRLAPLADQAREQAAAAKGKLAPLAATAAVGSAQVASKTKEQLQPHLQELADKVQPAVEQAHAKVTDELVPQLLDLLQEQLDSHPAVGEGVKRSQAAAAALRGDLELPEKKQRSVGGTVAKVAAATAVLAAAAVAVRQFLATKDDAWTAHQPSSAYVNESPASSQPATGQDDSASIQRSESSSTGESVTAEEPSADAAAGTWVDKSTDSTGTTEATLDAGEVEESFASTDGTTPVEAVVVSTDAPVSLHEYGEGSYVGEQPPAEYTIKGNERSMKYHTADSAGYERTIADVWFTSAEAAEAAGFTRAQR